MSYVAYSVSVISRLVRGTSPEECHIALTAHRIYMSGEAADPAKAVQMALEELRKERLGSDGLSRKIQPTKGI